MNLSISNRMFENVFKNSYVLQDINSSFSKADTLHRLSNILSYSGCLLLGRMVRIETANEFNSYLKTTDKVMRAAIVALLATSLVFTYKLIITFTAIHLVGELIGRWSKSKINMLYHMQLATQNPQKLAQAWLELPQDMQEDRDLNSKTLKKISNDCYGIDLTLFSTSKIKEMMILICMLYAGRLSTYDYTMNNLINRWRSAPSVIASSPELILRALEQCPDWGYNPYLGKICTGYPRTSKFN